MGNLISAVVVIGICILLFLALRQVMLWYWKVDTMIKNQELNNKLLSNNNALLNEQLSFMKSQVEPRTELKPEQGFNF